VAGARLFSPDVRFFGSACSLRYCVGMKQEAAPGHQAPNQAIAEEFGAATMGRQPRADFLQLAGKWVDDPAFDKIIAAQRQIDPDKWE
jgi:hypothetical protein